MYCVMKVLKWNNININDNNINVCEVMILLM